MILRGEIWFRYPESGRSARRSPYHEASLFTRASQVTSPRPSSSLRRPKHDPIFIRRLPMRLPRPVSCGDGILKVALTRGVGARIPRPRCATIDLLAIVATAGA